MKLLPRTRIFFICWSTYICIYICRVNISIALPEIKKTFQNGMGLAGIIGSAFFMVYAVGQLVNGFLGDRLASKKLVAAALLGTVLMNLIIGISNSIMVIAVCWGINGYFQSMVWGPLMRILSGLFNKEELRRVSTRMSTTMVLGYALAWTVLGRVILFASWKWLFLIPAGVGALMLAVWLLFIENQQEPNTAQVAAHRTILQSLDFITKRRLWLLVSSCCFMGIVKEGISLWAPILFHEAIGLSLSNSLSLVLLIPLANLCGIFFAGWLHKMMGRSDLYPVLVMCGIILMCAGIFSLPLGLPKMVSVILIACISAMSYGCNCIFLSLIPLRFGKDNMVSTLVGTLDFSTYVGAALSSVITGFVVPTAGWSRIPILWLVAGGIGLLLLFLQVRTRPKKEVLTIVEQEV